MSSLYLAANFIPATGHIPGFSGYAHLQIVYGIGPDSLELEVQAPPTITLGYWEFSPAKTHTDTPNYLDPELYKAVEIVDEANGAENIWDILNQINEQYLNSQKFIDYDWHQNSNSFVFTLLNAVGISFPSQETESISPSYFGDEPYDSVFPGINTDILNYADTSIALNITGSPSSDVIRGGMGSDNIHGQNGDDYLSGRGGDDTLSGGSGNDAISGDEGDDSIDGSEGNDTISGDDGDDVISGGRGDDGIYGGDGNDIIFGEAGDDNIVGGEGKDKIDGGDGYNSLSGGAGDDILRSDGPWSNINGGDGNDTINIEAGDSTIIGGNGEDVIYGGSGRDHIVTSYHGAEMNEFFNFIVDDYSQDQVFSGEGDDTIEAFGSDLIFAGDGDDVINLYGYGTLFVDGGAGYDLYNVRMTSGSSLVINDSDAEGMIAVNFRGFSSAISSEGLPYTNGFGDTFEGGNGLTIVLADNEGTIYIKNWFQGAYGISLFEV